MLIPLQLLNQSKYLVRSLNFNVIDSTAVRLCRGQHEQDGVDLPHQLTEKSFAEIPLAFSVEDNTVLHHLRGVLTYVAQVGNLFKYLKFLCYKKYIIHIILYIL